MIKRYDQVIEGDAVAVMKMLPAKSVGAVISDPPFFISIGRTSGIGGIGDDPWLPGVSSMDQMVAWSDPVAAQVARTLRPGGASVFMGSAQSLAAWEVSASRAGLVWMADLTVLWNTGKPRNRNFGSLFTTIRWHATPGARHVFNSGAKRSIYSNVVVCDKVVPTKRIHPAQKPVELTNFLVSLLTDDRDLVVDPFCGSGSTLVSAAMCGRRWLGSDLERDYCRVASDRATHHDFEELGEIRYWVNGKEFPIE